MDKHLLIFGRDDMLDEQVMFATGDSKFNGVVRSNKTAAFIVDCLKTETTKEAIIDAMNKKYNAGIEEITEDVEKVLDTMRRIGALDE